MNKKQIHTHCVHLLKERIAEIREELSALKSSAEMETKSSMGDKYETGREMISQQVDKMANRLKLLENQLLFLQRIKIDEIHHTVQVGSLVKTNQAIYFICIPLGQVAVEDHPNIYLISPQAPLSQQMLGLKKGDVVVFNSLRQEIEWVE